MTINYKINAWTDYPFVELGDEAYKQAHIRRVNVLSYDGNKYCRIKIGEVKTEVKLGYLYEKPGRCGEVPTLRNKRVAILERLK